MFIKDIFAPRYILQGEDFPLILRWDSDVIVNLEVVYNSELVEIEDIYNVSFFDVYIVPLRNNFKKVLINGVTINGYIGAKFRTKKTSDVIGEVPITVLLRTLVGIELKTLTVYTIKPVIKILDSPKVIHISRGDDNKHPKVKGKFKLKNIGQGTAILDFSIVSSSEGVSIGPPPLVLANI